MGLLVDDPFEQRAGDRRDRLVDEPRDDEVLDERTHLGVGEPAQPGRRHPHDLRHDPSAVRRHPEPLPDPLPDAGDGEAFAGDLLREEVLGDELLEVAADLVLALGDDRRVRIGSPSGCRNSAVTANQSASAPTMAASAAVLTYPHTPSWSRFRVAANTTAARPEQRQGDEPHPTQTGTSRGILG